MNYRTVFPHGSLLPDIEKWELGATWAQLQASVREKDAMEETHSESMSSDDDSDESSEPAAAAAAVHRRKRTKVTHTRIAATSAPPPLTGEEMNQLPADQRPSYERAARDAAEAASRITQERKDDDQDTHQRRSMDYATINKLKRMHPMFKQREAEIVKAKSALAFLGSLTNEREDVDFDVLRAARDRLRAAAAPITKRAELTGTPLPLPLPRKTARRDMADPEMQEKLKERAKLLEERRHDFPAHLSTRFSVEMHFAKLRAQQDRLEQFTASRPLDYAADDKTGTEWKNRYPASGKKKAAEKGWLGLTAPLGYDTSGWASFEDKFEMRESEYVPGTIGIFAREEIPHRLEPKRGSGKRDAEFVYETSLPYRGSYMSNDSADMLQYEVECPTSMPLKKMPAAPLINKNSGWMMKGDSMAGFTLVGLPTSFACIVNSVRASDAGEQKKVTFEGKDKGMFVPFVNCHYRMFDTEPEFRGRKEETGTGGKKKQSEFMGWGKAPRRDAHARAENCFSDYAVHVCLTRKVYKGEELLIDYGAGFWGGEDEERWPGCEVCQMKLTDKDEIPEEYGMTTDKAEWVMLECEKCGAGDGVSAAAASAAANVNKHPNCVHVHCLPKGFNREDPWLCVQHRDE